MKNALTASFNEIMYNAYKNPNAFEVNALYIIMFLS